MSTASQLWIINGKVAYQGPFCPYLKSTSLPSGRLHYAFYDQKTGDVWGKRLGSHQHATWIFTPGEPPDLRLPFEIEQNFMPDQYFFFLLNYMIEAQNLTTIPQAVILNPNNPNPDQGINK